MNQPPKQPPPYGPSKWEIRFNRAAVPVIVALAAIGDGAVAVHRWVRSAMGYAANRLYCCAACHERFTKALGHPMATVLVLLAGLSVNTWVQSYYGRRAATDAAAVVAAKAERINDATLRRTAKLYQLRKYTDDGIADVDSILRSYSPLHPGVVLPPPLGPRPSYDMELPPTTQP